MTPERRFRTDRWRSLIHFGPLCSLSCYHLELLIQYALPPQSTFICPFAVPSHILTCLTFLSLHRQSLVGFGRQFMANARSVVSRFCPACPPFGGQECRMTTLPQTSQSHRYTSVSNSLYSVFVLHSPFIILRSLKPLIHPSAT